MCAVMDSIDGKGVPEIFHFIAPSMTTLETFSVLLFVS